MVVKRAKSSASLGRLDKTCSSDYVKMLREISVQYAGQLSVWGATMLSFSMAVSDRRLRQSGLL